ncbi:MAG TPA: hypothetical protein VK083_09145 [Nocardia sp.]|uniref:hypothetical protein n=1 Tax=Nocardia TaxID=1817 RepID=UPI0024585D36|nr:MULTISPECIES: hypothetical protein [Nocardia]HLS76940.1 hypothetical protein [Nocardia sp.]
MPDTAQQLEDRIAHLRASVRRAVSAGDRVGARQLRAQLRQAENAWEDAVLGIEATDEPAEAAPAVPVREHVHRALTLLGAPAAPKLVLGVHEAFFSGELVPARLTSLRRDEERSFRSAPQARPYYICAALTADLLAPARGLLAVSTWPLERRVIGPLSPRVDLLTAVIRLAGHLADQPAADRRARRVLWKLAISIPGVRGGPDSIDPAEVARCAERELAVHRDDDATRRSEAAQRALDRLDQADQLFGVRLGVAGRAGERGDEVTGTRRKEVG